MRDEHGDIKTVVADKSYDTNAKARYVFRPRQARPSISAKMKKEACASASSLLTGSWSRLLTSDGTVGGRCGL